LSYKNLKERKEKMKLIKRNGSEVIFDREKITVAVTKANEAVDEKHRISQEDIENIALEVERLCLTMVRSAGVEEIQDIV
jgi:ribonucleoside-triphosphate reductase